MYFAPSVVAATGVGDSVAGLFAGGGEVSGPSLLSSWTRSFGVGGDGAACPVAVTQKGTKCSLLSSPL